MSEAFRIVADAIVTKIAAPGPLAQHPVVVSSACRVARVRMYWALQEYLHIGEPVRSLYVGGGRRYRHSAPI